MKITPFLLKPLCVSLTFAWVNGAMAAATDLANAPLANSVVATVTVKPNLALILDDSGSTNDENMPDDDGTNKTKKCWGWLKYNTLAYDPGFLYKPPYKVGGTVYSDGITRYADAVFTAALRDGYFPNPGYTFAGGSTSNGTVNLSVVANLPTTATTKYYYAYPTSSADNASTACLADTSYTAVTSSANIAAPGVSDGSAAALTNYANWYSYYRKRAYMQKAAVSEAFSTLSDQYRVGLFFIGSPESGAAGSPHPNNDLIISDFTGTHRTTWFERVQGTREALYTPLRGALARTGRIYAGQISGWDPVQYSCQQNFAILTTDGYWNTNWENSSTSYGPYKIDGTTLVGNTDGGPIAPVAATATIGISSQSSGTNACYRATSLTVVTSTGSVQLLDAASAPASCTTSRSTLGTAIAQSINNKSGITGFTASWGSNTITITAPTSEGALTVSPSLTMVKDSGSASRSFTVSAFGGYVAGTAGGASLPYRDALNKENTLADIAYYYYTTDLRTPALNNCTNTIASISYTDLCKDNVFGAGKDVNVQQHMTTFTLGLGASGKIFYETNYETAAKDSDAATTQYYDIAHDTANWPDPIANSSDERIDDLWHAAVNGRGTYFSAANAKTFAQGLSSALQQIQAVTGASAAAATSNLEPVAGDNFVFVALYRTLVWDGDVQARTIDPDSGAISTGISWSAQAVLDSQVAAAGAGADGRTIKFFNSSAADKLTNFTYANLPATSKTYFENFCSKVPTPDQCGVDPTDLKSADPDQRTPANSGTNLVNYLRGQSTYEDENSAEYPLYRGREHVLGDIVNAVPVYLKKAPFYYDLYDSTYATFKSNVAGRAGTVFAAANDGMLHAINAESDDSANNGKERWAYVPSFVMPNMWKLADKAYGTHHQYLVDGSPSVADVCSSSTATGCADAADWKTILVAGLNKGGCGYYALDVTDPTSPKGLWEFSHEQLGYSFGNPIVTRRKDGKWVVIFASGYNNVPGSGCASSTASSDGNGHVFVLDALSGALLENIPTNIAAGTPAGDTTTPSGLAKLNVWLDNADINIASRIYGGDLNGNVWRIDFDDNYNSNGKDAFRIAQLVNSSGVPQPITTKIELNEVKSGGAKYNLLLAATGKFLGLSDPADTSQNTIYGLKDQLTLTPIADVRGSTMVSRTMVQGTNAAGQSIRTISGSAIDWASNDGWYVDLNPSNLSPGERVTTDMQLFFNMLGVAANVPNNSVCTAGGDAWLYFFDIGTGLHMNQAVNSAVGIRLGTNALVAGIKTVKLSNGKTVTIVTDTAGKLTTTDTPPASGSVKLWRSNWREIPF